MAVGQRGVGSGVRPSPVGSGMWGQGDASPRCCVVRQTVAAWGLVSIPLPATNEGFW